MTCSDTQPSMTQHNAKRQNTAQHSTVHNHRTAQHKTTAQDNTTQCIQRYGSIHQQQSLVGRTYSSLLVSCGLPSIPGLLPAGCHTMPGNIKKRSSFSTNSLCKPSQQKVRPHSMRNFRDILPTRLPPKRTCIAVARAVASIPGLDTVDQYFGLCCALGSIRGTAILLHTLLNHRSRQCAHNPLHDHRLHPGACCTTNHRQPQPCTTSDPCTCSLCHNRSIYPPHAPPGILPNAASKPYDQNKWQRTQCDRERLP